MFVSVTVEKHPLHNCSMNIIVSQHKKIKILIVIEQANNTKTENKFQVNRYTTRYVQQNIEMNINVKIYIKFKNQLNFLN